MKYLAAVQLRHLYHLLAYCHQAAVLTVAEPATQGKAAPGPETLH